MHGNELSLRFLPQRTCPGMAIARSPSSQFLLTAVITKYTQSAENDGLQSTCGWHLKEFPAQTSTVIKTAWCTVSLLQRSITGFFSVQTREARKEQSCKETFFPLKCVFSVSHFNHWSCKSLGFIFFLSTFVSHFWWLIMKCMAEGTLWI